MLGTLVPIGLVALDILRHGQNVPFWDEWDVPMDVALLTAEGRLGVGDLFRQHNDGRVFFTYLVTAISTLLAGWSLKLEMFVSLLLAAVTLILVASLYGQADPARRWLVWVPVSMLVFSFVQRRTWLWAIQNQYWFAITFGVGALWLVRRLPPGGVALAGAAALTLCATFSYANGVLLWFVMFPVLWMLGYRRPALAAWAGAAALALGAYFLTGYRFHALERPLSVDPAFLARFVVVFLGNVFTVHEVTVHPPWEIHRTAALGSLGLVLFVANLALLWRSRRSWTDLAAWIGLGLFVVGSAVLAGIARNHLGGIEAAMASRYVTLATMFWVAFVVVAVLAMRWLGATRPEVVYVNGAVLTVLLALFVVGSLRFAGSRATVTEAQRACFVAYPTSGDDSCFADLFPSLTKSNPYGAHLLAKLERLAQHRLAAFGETPRP